MYYFYFTSFFTRVIYLMVYLKTLARDLFQCIFFLEQNRLFFHCRNDSKIWQLVQAHFRICLHILIVFRQVKLTNKTQFTVFSIILWVCVCMLTFFSIFRSISLLLFCFHFTCFFIVIFFLLLLNSSYFTFFTWIMAVSSRRSILLCERVKT